MPSPRQKADDLFDTLYGSRFPTLRGRSGVICLAAPSQRCEDALGAANESPIGQAHTYRGSARGSRYQHDFDME
jgi:hypothetical protein